MDAELAHRFWNEAPDAAIAVKADGPILFWTCAAELIFGYPAPEAVGQPVRVFLSPNARRAPLNLTVHTSCDRESTRRVRFGKAARLNSEFLVGMSCELHTPI